MEKDEVYAAIREKYPDFEMKYYTNTFLTKENLQKYGVDVLYTLAEAIEWKVRDMLQDGVDSGGIVPEGLEDRVKREDTSVFSQEMQDLIANKDAILQDYAYFFLNREWGILNCYWEPEMHIKILQHVKANGAMENYKKVEELMQQEGLNNFEPTGCLLLSNTARQLFSGKTIYELSRKIQSVAQEPYGKILVAEFDALFKDSPEKLAVLFSKDFQKRIFGRPYDSPPKPRQQITKEEVDILYKQYCEIITKFPQDLLKTLNPISYDTVYDQLVQANKAGFLKDASMIENYHMIRKQVPDFVPIRWYLLSNEFVKSYSMQELINFSEEDIVIQKIDDYGLALLRLVSLEELKEPKKERKEFDDYYDPLDDIFGGGIEEEKEEYTPEKFARDILNDEEIRSIVNSFQNWKSTQVLHKITKLQFDTFKHLIDRIGSLRHSDLEDIKEIYRKAKKFEEVANFIPALHVLLKYPEEQIEKFNKKRWFTLVKHSLYNESNSSKWALIEAILSMGVFEKDEQAIKRFGLLQRFATYLPKEIDVDSYNLEDYIQNCGFNVEELLHENFELVSEQNILESLRYQLNPLKLLNDPTFLRMFGGDQEKAQRQLLDWNLLPSMSPAQMENVLQGLGNEQEIENSEERAIIQYIYQKGYDEIYDTRIHFRLTTDLQALDIKTGKALEATIKKMYEGLDVSNMMTADKMHRIFDGMDMRYKPGFYNFFMNNLGTILESETAQKMLSKIQKQWEGIEESFLGQRITFDMCQSYFASIQYQNAHKNLELSKLSVNCGYNQEQFDAVSKIYQKQLERTTSSIPAIWEETSSKEGYTYQVLRLDDPATIFVGELTNCCQAIDDAGESCMIHSATSQNGRVLVVKDEGEKVVSQSWIWRNKNVLCFDNVEAVQRESNHRRVISNEILNTIQRAAQKFVEVDKEQFENWRKSKLDKLTKQKESGEISEQEFEKEKAEIEEIVNSQRLTKVTVGSGYSDISLKGLQADDENRYPEEKVKYIADSRKQFVLYKDATSKDTTKPQSTSPTIALYEDPQELQRLIHIDTSELQISEGETIDDDYPDDFYVEGEEVYDNGFRIAKEEVESFVSKFLNNTTREEAQEFIAEITRSLEQKKQEEQK